MKLFTTLSKQAENPSRIAIIDRNPVTYLCIMKKSSQLAKHLWDQGARPGDCVVTLLAQSNDLVCVMLACFKVGAIYVPLSPEERPGKITDTITDSAPKLIITSSDNKTLVEGYQDCAVVLMDESKKVINQLPHTEISYEAPEDSIAFILYTSGTTSRPRGVQITYRAIHYWLDLLKEKITSTSPIRMLSYISPSFDAHIWEYLVAFSKGGCNIITPPQVRVDPKSLAEFIVSNNVTHALFLPTVLEKLLPELEKIKRRLSSPLPISDLYSTGEALTSDLIEATIDLGITPWNCYGSTEEGFGLSVQECTNENTWEGKAPVAYPEGTDCYAFLVPRGQEGEDIIQELYTSTPHLSPGYLRRPKETSEKFVEVQHSGKVVRAFKTGDQFVVAPNGLLYCLGRISNDAHLKLNARMVRLQEIESKLKEIPHIQSACVVSCSLGGRTFLHAFVSSSAEVNPQELKKHLALSLTPESIPLNFDKLEEIPETTNGKKDRRTLKEKATKYYKSRSDPLEEGTFSPRSAFPVIEKILWTIWAAVIENFKYIREIDAETPFHILGGSSLELARMASMISSKFKVPFSISNLPNSPEKVTILELSKSVYVSLCKHAESSNITPLHQEDPPQGPPIFLIHEITGDASGTYLPLSKELSKLNRSVYAIDSRARLDDRFLCSDLDSIALDYATNINKIQPEGPCTLVGWSSGSTIAYCTALSLESMGRKVSFLGLIDGIYPHVYQSANNSDLLRETCILVNKLGVKIEQEALERDDINTLNKFDLVNWVFNVAGKLLSSTPPPPRVQVAHQILIAFIRVQISNRKTNATPHVFSTPETAEQMARLSRDQVGAKRDLGWLNQNQTTVIHPPMGNEHVDIITKQAPNLVGALSLYINLTPKRRLTGRSKAGIISHNTHLLSTAIQSLLKTVPMEEREALLEDALAQVANST